MTRASWMSLIGTDSPHTNHLLCKQTSPRGLFIFVHDDEGKRSAPKNLAQICGKSVYTFWTYRYSQESECRSTEESSVESQQSSQQGSHIKDYNPSLEEEIEIEDPKGSEKSKPKLQTKLDCQGESSKVVRLDHGSSYRMLHSWRWKIHERWFQTDAWQRVLFWKWR